MNNHNDLNINNKYKVLFVCLGNICRSPAAQGIFEHVVRENGMQEKIEADSAGTYSGHRGELPDRRMRTAALYRGFALTHKARPVSGLDFLDFDLIIAMDDQNYEDLMHLAPSVEATHKIRRMADFLIRRQMPYIPDPYYMGAEGFSLVLDLLEDGCQNLYEAIIKAEFADR
jgi:protein-tyrosine phosphatase